MIAALAAGFFACSTLPSSAADGPLAPFAGNFAGAGKVTLRDGASERIRCRSTNAASGKTVNLRVTCAGDSYKFELASDLTVEGNAISGSWNESTRGVVGTVSGRINGTSIAATASALGITAALSVRASGNSLSVSINSPGAEVQQVAVTMAKR